MIPSSRSRSAASTPQRSSPSWASGSSRRSTSSRGRHLAEPGPEQARVDAVARAGVEVRLGGRERHPRPDRAVLVGQHADQPVVEGGVGEHVDDGRAGGQDAVLDAQVRACRARRRRPAGSSGRRCRCAAAARRAGGRRRPRAPRPGPPARTPAAAPGSSATFSSKRSKIDVIQRSPNQTRGRTPCALSSSGRVSVACSNSAIRVSRHSSLPKKNGELAADRELHAGDRLRGVPDVANGPGRPAGGAARSCRRPPARSCRRTCSAARRRRSRSAGPLRGRRRSAR